ncbi:superinfection immunity protein [Trinickia fusca]|uniref:Superinfection immunity protein n=1 Tax=Trinickia fusca TaxID=2419777 RepID=A0A494X4C5_9BURK|nr:superinfection immunity protein [Trinickia fusca]RKP45200.1 superinfection immunity protein [Trinickia fusca]
MWVKTIVQIAEIVAALALYFLPAIMADRRKRHDLLTIALFNACLGWTVLGWVIAMRWALVPNPPPDLEHDVVAKRRLVGMRTFSKALVTRIQQRGAKRNADAARR